MSVTKLLYENKASFSDGIITDHTAGVYTLGTNAEYVFSAFEQPEDEFKFKPIQKIFLSEYAALGRNSIGRLLQQFNELNVVPSEQLMDYENVISNSPSAVTIRDKFDIPLFMANDVLKNGVYTFSNQPPSKYYTYRDAESSKKTYLSVTFGDSVVVTEVEAQNFKSGFIDKTKSNTFQWAIIADEASYALPEQTSGKFRYKTSASGAVTEIPCGTNQYVIIPANTFTTNTIYWQVQATDETGQTNASEWYVLTTIDETSHAVAVSPKNVMIDGSIRNRFSWQHIISTGTAPHGYNIVRSRNGTDWENVIDAYGFIANTYYDVPEYNFAAGTWFWKVRTYNSSLVPGEWSETVQIVVMSAPEKPTVIATNEPRPLISWQAEGQQGFRIEIDGIYDSGTVYGTDSSFRLPMILRNGSYTVKVKVQNLYGLWSEYGTAGFIVENQQDEEITLTVGVENSIVSLSWETDGNYSGGFIVYRDGKPIKKTNETYYKDNLSSGIHNYFIRGIYTGSTYYGDSDTVGVNAESSSLMIIDVNDQTRIMNIQHSTETVTTVNISESVEMTLRKYTGAEYPSAEFSGFKSKTMTFEAAFMDASKAEEFRSYLGKLVCVKKGRNSVIGVMNSTSSKNNRFYTSFSCSVSQIDFNEEIPI